MIVTKEDFNYIIDGLSQEPIISLDTETLGLRVWGEHKLFSIIVGMPQGAFYFNFHDYKDDPDFLPQYLLPRDLIKQFGHLVGDINKICFLHNAKFDMGMLYKEGVEFNCITHCTEAIARVERNDHLTYSLGDCAERIGEKKDDAVEAYIKEHHLWKWETVGGKKNRTKQKFFDQVPFKIIVPYGEQDAMVTLKLGLHQIKEIEKISLQNNTALKPLSGVMNMERELTKTFFEMEKLGVKFDPDYCGRAISYEESRYKKAMDDFKSSTHMDFADSNKVLAEAFTRAGEVFPTTEKGNPSFTDEVLSGFTSPIAKIVQEYRDAYKRCNTYFRNFLLLGDENNFIHPNIRQGGTKTGRISYAEPNFQNLTKDEDLSQPFPVRRAIVPPEGFLLLSIDYDQQELRLMLDYAGELELIGKIMEGLDPHQATADLVGIPRRPAKNLSFGLLYGMGLAKMARQIGCTEDEAREYKRKYFASLSGVRRFLRACTETAEKRGFVFNWFGRRMLFPDVRFCYRAANGIIQGGCADIAKIALNQIQEFLLPYKTKMAIQVHDEIMFMLHKDELFLVPELKNIMESVYPYRHIPLTCSVSHSFLSWGDMVEGEPIVQEIRDEIQGKSDRSISKGSPQLLVPQNSGGF